MKILNTLDGAKRVVTDSDNRFVNDSEKSAIVHSNRAVLDATSASFTTALKTGYDGAVTDKHTHNNTTALNAVSGTNTGNETASSIGSIISGAAVKSTPVDADAMPLMDSAASNITKKLSWANIKATLKTYFDTLYNNYSHPTYTYTNPTDNTGTTLTTVDLISTLTTNNGHVTGGTKRNLVAGTNVSIIPESDGDIVISSTDTNTVTTINSKTGTILKADIVALGIPAQDTTYSNATMSVSGLMSNTDKSKLDGVAASANNYSHPTGAGSNHIPSGGASGQFLKYSSSGVAIWANDNNTTTTINGKTGAIAKADIVALGIPAQDTTYSNATTSVSGLMSNTDKSKLNTIDNTIRSATITAAWTGSSAPFTQDITVAGMTSDAVPIISPVYSATLSTALLEKEAWNLISKIETGSGKIIATCFEEKPIIAINIQLKGM